MMPASTDVAPVVGIVAGEASSDLLGAHLVTALKARRPDLRFAGIAGPRMIAAGVEALFPSEKLAVRGYVEVLRHYLEIVSIRRRLTKHFLAQPPQVFIGIDAPDFNLDLELQLRNAGIATVHYVSPAIWAWRPERIHKIKQAVDHMLALFPFETSIYEKAGVPASFVGHPLADMLAAYPSRAEVRATLNIPADVPVVALLPGSRVSELQHMGGLFLDTAREIVNTLPAARFVAPFVNDKTRTLFSAAQKRANAPDVMLLDGRSHDAIAAADVVLVASGTATLETALLKRPMVIAYKMPRLSYWLLLRHRYQSFVGLPNILAGESVVPELLQDEATPANLAREVIDLFNDSARRQRIAQRFEDLLQTLRQNTAEKAAEAVLPFLDRKRV